LFNAGDIAASSLTRAVQAAYADKNYQQRGRQPLAANQAVLFTWQKLTYLGVNDRISSFSTSRDLLVELAGAAVDRRSAGLLTVSNYFA
jgi:hypothetical protein